MYIQNRVIVRVKLQIKLSFILSGVFSPNLATLSPKPFEHVFFYRNYVSNLRSNLEVM